MCFFRCKGFEAKTALCGCQSREETEPAGENESLTPFLVLRYDEEARHFAKAKWFCLRFADSQLKLNFGANTGSESLTFFTIGEAQTKEKTGEALLLLFS